MVSFSSSGDIFDSFACAWDSFPPASTSLDVRVGNLLCHVSMIFLGGLLLSVILFYYIYWLIERKQNSSGSLGEGMWAEDLEGGGVGRRLGGWREE